MGEQTPKPSAIWTVLGGISALVWRIFTQAPSLLWRDWVAVLSVYWILAALSPRGSLRDTATVSLIAYLLGIYLLGQAPHTLAALGFRP